MAPRVALAAVASLVVGAGSESICQAVKDEVPEDKFASTTCEDLKNALNFLPEHPCEDAVKKIFKGAMASCPKLAVEKVGPGETSGDYYVFLQRFRLTGPDELFHTEVLVCPRAGFLGQEQSYLDRKISGMSSFAEIHKTFWEGNKARCVELGYTGSDCTDRCCTATHKAYTFGERKAMIKHAVLSTKAVFIYGTSAFDGQTAWQHACEGPKCWSNWAGTDYNFLDNNCNTFTSTILYCIYGLSQKKPNLGRSDMIFVRGHCGGSQSANSSVIV